MYVGMYVYMYVYGGETHRHIDTYSRGLVGMYVYMYVCGGGNMGLTRPSRG
jgi:hypothetical protein